MSIVSSLHSSSYGFATIVVKTPKSKGDSQLKISNSYIDN